MKSLKNRSDWSWRFKLNNPRLKRSTIKSIQPQASWRRKVFPFYWKLSMVPEFVFCVKGNKRQEKWQNRNNNNKNPKNQACSKPRMLASFLSLATLEEKFHYTRNELKLGISVLLCSWRWDIFCWVYMVNRRYIFRMSGFVKLGPKGDFFPGTSSPHPSFTTGSTSHGHSRRRTCSLRTFPKLWSQECYHNSRGQKDNGLSFKESSRYLAALAF